MPNLRRYKVCGTVPRRLSAFHGCSRGRPVVVCDGGSTSGTGRRVKDRERASGKSDCPCPDQDRQARLPDVGPLFKGEPHSGGLSAGGVEPAGVTGDEDAGLLGPQANGSEEQDLGAFCSKERGSSVGGEKAGEWPLQLEGIGVYGQTALGGQRKGGFRGSSPRILGDPGAHHEVGRIGERPLWGDGGGVSDRHRAGFAKTLSVLVAVEIADVKRFSRAADLHSYAGVIPSTYSSEERTYHGHITKQGRSSESRDDKPRKNLADPYDRA